jgi:hypothetical protein
VGRKQNDNDTIGDPIRDGGGKKMEVEAGKEHSWQEITLRRLAKHSATETSSTIRI